MRVMVTGGAGFIGSHVCDALLARGDQVVCVDNFNDYYDPARKQANITQAAAQAGFTLAAVDFRDAAAIAAVFEQTRPQALIHLGAMAGPRPSLDRPELYESVNVGGTLLLLDLARRYGLRAQVLASTSSVYGLSPTPWNEATSATDRPLSPYAATKKAAEVLAYTYHYQYGVPTRIVRFFTVYGPRGRPDMTPYTFVTPMVAGRPFVLFNAGVGIYRDWTYIDDIVAGVLAALDADLAFEIFNLGNANPVELAAFVATIERVSGYPALIESRPLPSADPPITFADTSKAAALLGFAPKVQVEAGIAHFWAWYCDTVAQR